MEFAVTICAQYLLLANWPGHTSLKRRNCSKGLLQLQVTDMSLETSVGRKDTATCFMVLLLLFPPRMNCNFLICIHAQMKVRGHSGKQDQQVAEPWGTQSQAWNTCSHCLSSKGKKVVPTDYRLGMKQWAERFGTAGYSSPNKSARAGNFLNHRFASRVAI